MLTFSRSFISRTEADLLDSTAVNSRIKDHSTCLFVCLFVFLPGWWQIFLSADFFLSRLITFRRAAGVSLCSGLMMLSSLNI